MVDDDYIRPDIMQTIAASREAGAEFLVADMHLALTMLKRAANSLDAQTRDRNLINAQRACDTVLYLLEKLRLEGGPREKVEKLLSTAQGRLQAFRSAEGSVPEQIGDSAPSTEEWLAPDQVGRTFEG